MSLIRVEECWSGGWLGPSLFEATTDSFVRVGPATTAAEYTIPGTVFPGFVDSHVHLGLVDATRLLAGGIAAVDDLGWIPAEARQWRDRQDLPRVRFAGAFLTAPGGYPIGRDWAPRGSVVEIASPEQAADAVATQLEAGASFVKIALNTVAGPVLDDATLGAVVASAHSRGVTVVAHAEDSGQATRAFEVGVDRLAHAPFNEPLAEELLAAMAGRMSWVSTLDIHGHGHYNENFERAQHNVRRFAALGGEVHYGTDLGNGPLPLGINRRELAALADSLGADGTVAAIAAPAFEARFSWAPGLPRDQADVASWLATASVVSTTELEETFS